MMSFIDKHRENYGVEPICRQLPIAPSTYYEHKARERDPVRAPARVRRDLALSPQVQRVWEENYRVYGARKVWKQLNRERIAVARCAVERLMNRLGIRGVVRGKTVRTTVPGAPDECPRDLVRRQFKASRPDQLWVADFTYVRTWAGFVYTAFVIDVFAGCLVGWHVSRSPRTRLVLNALDQALWARKPDRQGLIHHSDRGVQYLSVRYTERLKDAGIEPSVGSVGDSYDNALAETVIGLYKTELIGKRGPWKTIGSVEYETCKWVDWYNNRRISAPNDYRTVAEIEAAHHATISESAMVA